MSVFGITMVKDEADIIGSTLPRMAAQLDGVIVADNMSSDGTSEILRQIASRFPHVEVVDDEEPAYLQSAKMTALADRARNAGATWVVPFDADEVWVWKDGAFKLWDLAHAEGPASVIAATLFDHVATQVDGESPDPVERMCWRRAEPSGLAKVACRTLPGLVIDMGNHGAHYPGKVVTTADPSFVVHHYPYRSAAQMTGKARNGAAAYAAAGSRLSPETGRHWRDYGALLDAHGPEAIDEVFRTWFYSRDPQADGLVCDPCPV